MRTIFGKNYSFLVFSVNPCERFKVPARKGLFFVRRPQKNIDLYYIGVQLWSIKHLLSNTERNIMRAELFAIACWFQWILLYWLEIIFLHCSTRLDALRSVALVKGTVTQKSFIPFYDQRGCLEWCKLEILYVFQVYTRKMVKNIKFS